MYIICVYIYIHVYYVYIYVSIYIYIYTYTHPIYISFTSHKSLISHQTLLFFIQKIRAVSAPQRGYLEPHEFTAALRQLPSCRARTEEEMAQLRRFVDLNGDPLRDVARDVALFLGKIWGEFGGSGVLEFWVL